MAFISVKLNDKDLPIAGSPISIQAETGAAKLVITTDKANVWPRVRVNNHDIKPDDNGKTFTVALGTGVTSIDLIHWVNGAIDGSVSYSITATNPASSFAWGIVAKFEDNVDFVIKLLKDLGLTNVRLWKSPQSDFSESEKLKIMKYAVAGLTLTLTLQPNPGWKSSDIDAGKWARNNAAVIAKYIRYVEAGNELNGANYRPTDLPPSGWHQWYVDRFLNPVADALPDIDIIVNPPADNWTPATYETEIQRMKLAGAYRSRKVQGKGKKYCGIHPYCTKKNIPAISDQLNKARSISGLELIATEANIINAESETNWVSGFPEYAKALKSTCSLAFYYRGMKNEPPQRGLITPTGTRMSYFDTFKANL